MLAQNRIQISFELITGLHAVFLQLDQDHKTQTKQVSVPSPVRPCSKKMGQDCGSSCLFILTERDQTCLTTPWSASNNNVIMGFLHSASCIRCSPHTRHLWARQTLYDQIVAVSQNARAFGFHHLVCAIVPPLVHWMNNCEKETFLEVNSASVKVAVFSLSMHSVKEENNHLWEGWESPWACIA